MTVSKTVVPGAEPGWPAKLFNVPSSRSPADPARSANGRLAASEAVSEGSSPSRATTTVGYRPRRPGVEVARPAEDREDPGQYRGAAPKEEEE